MSVFFDKAARWARQRRLEPLPAPPSPTPRPAVIVKPYAVTSDGRTFAWAGPLAVIAHDELARLFWNGEDIGTARWDGRRCSGFELVAGAVSGPALRAAIVAAEAVAEAAYNPACSTEAPFEALATRVRAALVAVPSDAILARALAPSSTPTASAVEALAVGAETSPFLAAVLAGVEEDLAEALASPWLVEPASPACQAHVATVDATSLQATRWRRSWCPEPGCYLVRNHAPPCRMGMETWV